MSTADTGTMRTGLLLCVLTVLAAVGSVNSMPGYPGSRDPRRACPCSTPDLCQPITKTAKYEVFTFMVTDANYLQYDWTRISTVVLFAKAVSDKVMCYAHSKGVKVSYGADFPVNSLTDPAARTAWVAKQVFYAHDNFLDGINLDFESSIAADDTARREGLSSLVSELTNAFKTNFSNSQVTFDTPYTPYSARHFDYAHIANTMDFIALMAYDEQGYCVPGANSDYRKAVSGIQAFMALGIKPQKMVLALPWYGYDYPCGNISKENVCTVAPHCGGRQTDYSAIMGSYFNTTTSGRLWDNSSLTPYFSYKDTTGKLRQSWYDDKVSLGLKYKYAATTGLRGVGMWHADALDYSETPEGRRQRSDMWGELPVVNANDLRRRQNHTPKSQYNRIPVQPHRRV